MKPKISLVMPSYNQPEYLEEAINSILDQEYPNLEFILIDGGSDDNRSTKKVSEIIKKYVNYFSYWCSEPDGGHASALNKGFKQSTGDIMLWLNSDDIMCEGSLHKIGDIFEQFPEINWLTGKITFLNPYGWTVSPPTIAHTKYTFINGDAGGVQSEGTCWRRSLWERAGSSFNVHFQLLCDQELWSRFFLLDELWYIDDSLAKFRFHDTNRGHLFQDQVVKDFEELLNVMKSKFSEEDLQIAQQIKGKYLPLHDKNTRKIILEAAATFFSTMPPKLINAMPTIEQYITKRTWRKYV